VVRAQFVRGLTSDYRTFVDVLEVIMMNAKLVRAAAFMLATVVLSIASAADSLPQLDTKIVKSKDGRLAVQIAGTAPDSAQWLGVSFYLPDYKDATWDADHAVYAVQPGPLKLTCPVPAGYEKGTYEVGLWKQKLGANTFYQPAGLRGYATGVSKYGPTKTTLADSVVELTTASVSKDGKRTLDVSGKATAGGWLGVSFYKHNYADAVLDGAYSMLSVAGDFSQSLVIPSGYEEGTYEVALWQRLVARKNVYRLAGELAAGSGAIGK
jgi:hypothetical protein